MANFEKANPKELLDYIKSKYHSDINFKTEYDDAIGHGSQTHTTNPTDELVAALNKLNIGNSFTSTPPIFNKGDNFISHCNRFALFVDITNLSSSRQYAVFLSTFSHEETQSRIGNIDIEDHAKLDHRLFLPIVKKAIYGEQRLELRRNLYDCVQKSTESIADYVYRINQKIELAYPDIDDNGDTIANVKNIRDENSLFVFLKGIYDINIKRKVNELPDLKSFSVAVKHAKHLERVDKTMNPNSEANNPLSANLTDAGILRMESRSNDRNYSSRSYRSRNSGGYKKLECFACRGNHFVRNCPYSHNQ